MSFLTCPYPFEGLRDDPSGLVQEVRPRPPSELVFGAFRIDRQKRRLSRNGAPVRLGERAFDILQRLVERGGEIVDKRELFQAAWPGLAMEDSNLRVQLSAIRRALEPGDPRAPRIVNVAGRGYRLLWSGETAKAPAPIGRAAFVAKVAAALSAGRLLTLVGAGGIGKTTIALAASQAWQAETGGAVHFVDLSPARSSDDVAAITAQVLGLRTRADCLREIAPPGGEPGALIVLDNCEHILGPAARLAEALLAMGGCAVLATSREAILIPRERVLSTPPLEAPPFGPTSAAIALRYSAVELLVSRIQDQDPAFTLSDADAEDAAAICRRLDGLPLALELAAARFHAMRFRQLYFALDHRFDVLNRGRRTAVERHRTLWSAVDWSYQLLSPQGQALLRRISVFCSVFTLDDAVGLSKAEASRGAVIAGLADLVAKCLVETDSDQGVVGYRLPETVRAFSAARMNQQGDAATTSRLAEPLPSQFAEVTDPWSAEPTREAAPILAA